MDDTTRRTGHARRGPLLSRRDLLKAGGAGVAGVVAGSLVRSHQARLLDRLLETGSETFDPSKVGHIVVLMQENRSFDHYFGTLEGVAGFRDPNAGDYATGVANAAPYTQAGPLAALPGWAGPTSAGQALLQPWHLVSDPPYRNGQTTNDITHDWTPQHQSWNGGAMDRWFSTHASVDTNNSLLGSTNDGYLTMGYLAQPDLAFYHALADAFTICDGYFCSVLGPTDPNRLMLMSNSVGVGQRNGPLLTTLVQTRPEEFGKLSWKTMPEALEEAGVTWKVYADPTGQALFDVLPYFAQYQDASNPMQPALALNAFGQQYPLGFAADVAAGTLPQVSWILPPAANCEHPAAPPEYGEYLVSQVLATLVSNPAVWERTVLIVTYDENGGWFDHVPPPTPDPADAAQWAAQGEWVSGLSSQGYVDGPVGLGFRVPCLVVSPFSRGGYVCSPYVAPAQWHEPLPPAYRPPGAGSTVLDPAGTFDHTSINRFIATVFGAQGYDVEVPNLSAWRRSVTGDLTTAFAGVVDSSVPELPPTSMADPDVAAQAVVNAIAGTVDYAPEPYPPPTANDFPPATDGAPLTPSYQPGSATGTTAPAG